MICNEIAGWSITTQTESTKQIHTSTYVLEVRSHIHMLKQKEAEAQKKDESQWNINNSPSNKSQQR
jgi:hypothetical protein